MPGLMTAVEDTVWIGQASPMNSSPCSSSDVRMEKDLNPIEKITEGQKEKLWSRTVGTMKESECGDERCATDNTPSIAASGLNSELPDTNAFMQPCSTRVLPESLCESFNCHEIPCLLKEKGRQPKDDSSSEIVPRTPISEGSSLSFSNSVTEGKQERVSEENKRTEGSRPIQTSIADECELNNVRPLSSVMLQDRDESPNRHCSVLDSVSAGNAPVSTKTCLTLTISAGVVTVCAVATHDCALPLLEELRCVVDRIEKVCNHFPVLQKDERREEVSLKVERQSWRMWVSSFLPGKASSSLPEKPQWTIRWTHLTPDTPFFSSFFTPLEMPPCSPERIRYEYLKEYCLSRLYRGCEEGRWTMEAVLLPRNEKHSENAPTEVVYDVGLELLLACVVSPSLYPFFSVSQRHVLQAKCVEKKEEIRACRKQKLFVEKKGENETLQETLRGILERRNGFPSAFPQPLVVFSSSHLYSTSRGGGGLFPSPSTVFRLGQLYTMTDCLVCIPPHYGEWDRSPKGRTRRRRKYKHIPFVSFFARFYQPFFPLFKTCSIFANSFSVWLLTTGKRAQDTLLRWWCGRASVEPISPPCSAPSPDAWSPREGVATISPSAETRDFRMGHTVTKLLLGPRVVQTLKQAEQQLYFGELWKAWHRHVCASLLQYEEYVRQSRLIPSCPSIHASDGSGVARTAPLGNPIPPPHQEENIPPASLRDAGWVLARPAIPFSNQWMLLKAIRSAQVEQWKWRRVGSTGHRSGTTPSKSRLVFFHDSECWLSKWRTAFPFTAGPLTSVESTNPASDGTSYSSTSRESVAVMDCRSTVRMGGERCATERYYYYGSIDHSANRFVQHLPSLLSSSSPSASVAPVSSDPTYIAPQKRQSFFRAVLIGALPRTQPLLPLFSRVTMLFPLLYFPLTGCTGSGSPVTVYQLRLLPQNAAATPPPPISSKELSKKVDVVQENEARAPLEDGETLRRSYSTYETNEDTAEAYQTAIDAVTSLQSNLDCSLDSLSVAEKRVHWSEKEEYASGVCMVPVSTGVAEHLLAALWAEAFRLLTSCPSSCTAGAIEAAAVAHLSCRLGPFSLLDLYGVDAAMSFLRVASDSCALLSHHDADNFFPLVSDHCPVAPPPFLSLEIALMRMWKERGPDGRCAALTTLPTHPIHQIRKGIEGNRHHDHNLEDLGQRSSALAPSSSLTAVREDVIRTYLRPALTSADIGDCLLGALANTVAAIISEGHVRSSDALHLLSTAALGMNESTGGLVTVLSNRLRSPFTAPSAECEDDDARKRVGLVESMQERYLQGVSSLWPHPLLAKMAAADQPLEEWITDYLLNSQKQQEKR